jgi:ribosomal protein L7Ae-like RNA K-turn-binding protein
MSELKLIDKESTKKILSSLGLCAKAGKLIYGVPMICEALRKGGASKPALVIESSDTSDGTHKKIADKTAFYQVRLVRIDCDGATLASALGKTASLAAVAIKDEKMCSIVEKYI